MSDWQKVTSLIYFGSTWNIAGMGKTYVESTETYSQNVNLWIDTGISAGKIKGETRFWFPGNGVDSYLAGASISFEGSTIPLKVNGKSLFYIPKEGRWSDWVSIRDWAWGHEGEYISVTFTFSIAQISAKIPTAPTAPTTPVGVSAYYTTSHNYEDIQRWAFKVDKSSGDINATVAVYLNDELTGTYDCDYTSSFDTSGLNTFITARWINAVAHIDEIQIVNDETAEVLLNEECSSLENLTSNIFNTGIVSVSPEGFIKLDSGTLGHAKVGTNITVPDKFTVNLAMHLDSLPTVTNPSDDSGLIVFVGNSSWALCAIFTATYVRILKGNNGSGYTKINGVDGIQGAMTLNPTVVNEVTSTCTLTVTTNPDPGDTLVLKGGQQGDITFTFVDHYPNNQNEIQIGADTNETASAIATAINNYTLAEFSAEASTNTVIVTSHISGEMTIEITGTGISAGTITSVHPGFLDEEVSAADSFTVTEGGKAVQENVSATDAVDGLIDGLSETVSATAVIDCLMDSMDEGANAADNFDGLIDYMGEET